MDESSYRAWWGLHLRAARGESLEGGERAVYEAGLAQLHQSESLAGGAASLSQARATIQTLEADYARLRAQREHLEAEIAALEAVLDARTREPLTTKD